MKKYGLIFVFSLVITSVGIAADSPAQKAFNKLKTLVGTWKGKSKDGMEGTIEYRLTGGGSTIVEILFPGEPMEMTTMYHMDGKDLVLTHYCAAKNQPSMKYVPSKSDHVFYFQFFKGSNMKRTDMHMHTALINVVSKDKVKSVWTSYQNGKKGGAIEFEIDRVK